MASKGKLKQNTNYTEEQKKKILGYGDQIVHLESFVDQVRQTADVFIGDLGNTGYLTLFREIFQNCTDEMQKEDSVCDHVVVTFDERSKWVIVEDNGRGFPHGKIESIICDDHTSSNYEKRKFQYTAGKNGMGIGIVNALSSEFSVESSVLGETHRVEFVEGYPWKKGEIKVKSDHYQGSVISFRPCIDVLGDITVTWTEVFYLVSSIVPTLKLGATIFFNAIDMNGINHHEVIVNNDGILTHLIEMCKSPIATPISIFQDTGEMRIEAIFTYDASDTNGELLRSFNNFCPTIAGTHENGLLDGICNYFRGYINKIYLSGKKLQVVNADILCGLRGVLSTCLLKPMYGGQNKDILKNPEIRPFAATVVYNTLDEWSKKNPKDLQKICKWIKDIAEVRVKNDSAKIKISDNFKKAVVGGKLPANYEKPVGRNDGHWELIIVEGKSAAGSAKSARDSNHQGIYGIRGKFPNAISNTRQMILGNAEAAGIISILDEGRGTNYGNKFDIKLCPYEKIILTTDADEDGVGHIRPLLLKFFLIYLRPLVEAGRLYGATPPLYMTTINKKHVYFSDDYELIEYVHREFCKSNTITDLNGRKLTKNEISALVLRNSRYTTLIKNVSSSLAVNPYLLEVILANYSGGHKKLKQIIEKRWRFLKVNLVNGITFVTGSIDKTQTVPIDDRFIAACGELSSLVRKSDIGYIVNGQQMSLYDTMKAFEKFKPANIQRFKGLGEMDADKLRESTIHPAYNRRLIQYTTNDIKKELNKIRAIESDFSILLKDIRGINKADIN